MFRSCVKILTLEYSYISDEMHSLGGAVYSFSISSKNKPFDDFNPTFTTPSQLIYVALLDIVTDLYYINLVMRSQTQFFN